MEQISKNFSMAEFSASATAANAGILNDIPDNVKPAVRALVSELLQPLCDYAGWRGKINSGYRSPALNGLVGGVATSQHVRGEAADVVFFRKEGGKTIYIASVEVLRVLTASGLNFDQAIAYNGFVHLSYTTARPNRRQILYNSFYTGGRI